MQDGIVNAAIKIKMNVCFENNFIRANLTMIFVDNDFSISY